MTTKEEMYDQLFPAIYLKMVEQFLPNLKQAPADETFAESDINHLLDLAEQARMIADMGANAHADGLMEDEGESSDN